jgi:hypothetical protein
MRSAAHLREVFALMLEVQQLRDDLHKRWAPGAACAAAGTRPVGAQCTSTALVWKGRCIVHQEKAAAKVAIASALPAVSAAHLLAFASV